MNFRMIGKFLSQILLLEAFFMIPAMLICLNDGELDVAACFLITIGTILVIAGTLYLFGRKANTSFFAREGMICVSGCWIAMSLLGCLPFYLSGQIPSYIDALFEIVSGFTTTGSSILSDVEALSRGLLFWRSFSHWIGGMGVLVLLLVFISAKNSNGFTLHLLRAESPGPSVGKLVPRMKKTATLLYVLYLVLTVLDFLFLVFGGMPVFDAVCTAVGTAGTGGFGIKNDSMASYSPYLQNVTTIFMLLFGVNFSCYYLLLIGNIRSFFKDEELKFYFFTVVSSIALIALNIRNIYATTEETVRHSAFQVATIITTSGFATTDFDLWPSSSKAILLCLMVIGACAGSTGGGMKCVRIILLLKSLKRSLRQTLYPNRVEVIQLNHSPVSEKVISSTNTYLIAYGGFVILSYLLVSFFDGHPPVTSFTAVLACFNNIGPGLEMVGPTQNFACFSVWSKLVLIMDMKSHRL